MTLLRNRFHTLVGRPAGSSAMTRLGACAVSLVFCGGGATACFAAPVEAGPRLPATSSETAATVEQLHVLQRARAERWRRVQSQLEALQHRQPAAATSEGRDGDPEPLPAVPELAVPPVVETDAAVPNQDVAEEQDTLAAPIASDRSGASAVSAPPVVEGSIDRLALADSLYAVGDAAAAEALYRRLDPADYTAPQRTWVEYQLAGCAHRRGDVAASAAQYRAIVDRGAPEWLATLARWRLTHQDDCARLRANTVRLSELMQSLNTEVTHELESATGATAPGRTANER